MSQIKDAKPIATKKPAIARSAMACMLLSPLVFGCGDADTRRRSTSDQETGGFHWFRAALPAWAELAAPAEPTGTGGTVKLGGHGR